MVTVHCSGGPCPGPRDAVGVGGQPPQVHAVEPFRLWRECFAKHDIDTHQTVNKPSVPAEKKLVRGDDSIKS